jgi:hypothetical protein
MAVTGVVVGEEKVAEIADLAEAFELPVEYRDCSVEGTVDAG